VANRQHAGPGPSISDVPEPSLAERARTLAAVARIGTLCTHSRKFPGFPFGSMMPYAMDGRGRPVFFVSTMAMHTQNLMEDGRASLLMTQPGAADDPLGAGRLTVVGNAGVVTADEVSELYLARHENARYWKDFSDFAYYRLEVAGVYFIGGFGVMGWIAAEEYASAAPDPLAHVAPGIIQKLNARYGDRLRDIARDEGATPDEAVVTAIDRLGFHLRLKTGDRVHGRRIAFRREVHDASQVEAAMVELGGS
jgi:putative heme iron utilization protein